MGTSAIGVADRQLLYGLRDALHALDVTRECKLVLLRQLYADVGKEMRIAAESGFDLDTRSLARRLPEGRVQELTHLP